LTSDKILAAFKRSQELIGANWIEYAVLQEMTTVSVIDHMLHCQKIGTEYLNREPYHDENREDLGSMWAACRNQVVWCLQVLQERDIYDADPYRDDKAYKLKSDEQGN
jgi:Flp pilus assembly pilin Flp